MRVKARLGVRDQQAFKVSQNRVCRAGGDNIRRQYGNLSAAVRGIDHKGRDCNAAQPCRNNPHHLPRIIDKRPARIPRPRKTAYNPTSSFRSGESSDSEVNPRNPQNTGNIAAYLAFSSIHFVLPAPLSFPQRRES